MPRRSDTPTDVASEAAPVDPVERKILEAMADGTWDDLPGMGRPLSDIDDDYQPGWWAKQWIERQRRSDAADALRRSIRDELPRLRAMRDRAAAAARVDEINALVDEVNRGLPDGEHVSPIRI
jgi:hypothetical protein